MEIWIAYLYIGIGIGVFRSLILVERKLKRPVVLGTIVAMMLIAATWPVYWGFRINNVLEDVE